MKTTADRGTTTRWGTLLVILSCDFLITLDFFIVNVTIPSIQDDLSASPVAVQFIIVGYALAYASGLILSGRLGDLHGRRRMFAWGTALFTVASAACGLAPSAGALVAARVIQGMAAAVMAPQMLAILGTVYTGQDRARAFNVAMFGKGMAAVFGQLVGGVLIALDVGGLGWRLCFLINVPIGIVVLALMPRVVPETRAPGRTGLDVPGAVLITAGLVMVILPLVAGHARGSQWWSLPCLVAAVALLAGFVRRQRRLTAAHGSPLVNTALFRDRTFSVGVSMVLLYYASMGAFFLILSLYLQHGSGLTALHAGLISTTVGVGFFGATVVGTSLMRRLGRQTIALGGGALALGWLALGVVVSVTGTTGGVGWLIPGLLVCGVGMGLVMASMTATAMSNVLTEHAGSASGVLVTAIQVGSAFGVALIGIVFYSAPSAAAGLSRGAILLIVAATGVAVLAQFLKGAHHGKDVRGGPATASPDHAVAGGH